MNSKILGLFAFALICMVLLSGCMSPNVETSGNNTNATVNGTASVSACDAIPSSPNAGGAFSETDAKNGWYYGDLDQKKPGTPAGWIHANEGTRSAVWMANKNGNASADGDCKANAKVHSYNYTLEDLYNSESSNIIVTIGDEFTITAPDPSDGGYKTLVDLWGMPNVQYLGSEMAAGCNPETLPTGGRCPIVYKFKAVAEGQDQIAFMTFQPWKGGDFAGTAVVDVNVVSAKFNGNVSVISNWGGKEYTLNPDSPASLESAARSACGGSDLGELGNIKFENKTITVSFDSFPENDARAHGLPYMGSGDAVIELSNKTITCEIPQ